MGNKFSDRVVVVTGDGSGIGAEICRTFAAGGASVAVTDLCGDDAGKIAQQIQTNGGQSATWELDVSDGSAVEWVAERIEATLGPISIWVNNAGISTIIPFLDTTEEIWDLTQNVNLKGTFFGCQAAIRRMLPKRSGVILNMSSQSGKVGSSHYSAYCASKFGIIGLTQSLAVEFAEYGIRVNALCPGVVFTPMWETHAADYACKKNIKIEEVRPYLESKIPMKRLGTPEDVARTAVFLAGDDASYITGQAINISGGSAMH